MGVWLSKANNSFTLESYPPGYFPYYNILYIIYKGISIIKVKTINNLYSNSIYNKIINIILNKYNAIYLIPPSAVGKFYITTHSITIYR
jgi:hypothetical protein